MRRWGSKGSKGSKEPFVGAYLSRHGEHLLDTGAEYEGYGERLARRISCAGDDASWRACSKTGAPPFALLVTHHRLFPAPLRLGMAFPHLVLRALAAAAPFSSLLFCWCQHSQRFDMRLRFLGQAKKPSS